MVFCSLAAVTAVAQVPTYTGVELPGGFVPTAINIHGQIAGYGDGPGGQVHAKLYSGGVLTDLGVLPGGDHSEATGINASGQVVGYSTTAGGLEHAFLYSGGVMIDLGTLPGGSFSRATAINDAGQVTGYSSTRMPNTSFPTPDHAFRYSGGVMVDLGNLSASGEFANFSRGDAINASGEVVGWSVTDNFDTHAFIHTGGQMIDLGTLGGSESRARGINAAGIVVGWSNTANDAAIHAFRHGGSMGSLGTLSGNNNSTASAINGSGQTVGHSNFSGTPAFIHTPATGMVRLDTRVSGDGWFLSRAPAINDAGQIIASGSNASAFGVYFLLTPAAGSVSVSVADVSLSEGNSGTRLATFTVSLSAASAGAVNFDIATADGTASAGSDYVALALSGQSIAAGATSKTYSVTINGDTQVEADETFSLSLANVSGASVADGQATGTIQNDDAAPPALSVSDVQILEGDGGAGAAVFTISLSSPAQAGGVSFDLAATSLRGTGNVARAGSDFASSHRAGVMIAAGQSSAVFPVKVLGDLRPEPDEIFAVQASNVVGASVADGAGVGLILDDDEASPLTSTPGGAATTAATAARACLRLDRQIEALVADVAAGRKPEAVGIRLILQAQSRRSRLACPWNEGESARR